MLPKRSACASRFWKLGYLEPYLFLSRSRPSGPPYSPIVGSPQKSGISTPNPDSRKASKTHFSTALSPYYARFGLPPMGFHGATCNKPPRIHPLDYNFLSTYQWGLAIPWAFLNPASPQSSNGSASATSRSSSDPLQPCTFDRVHATKPQRGR